MNNPKPPPQCKALLLCDHVILDSFTGKISLINVIEGFDLNYYPARAPVFYCYAILVNGIGHYDFKIEIIDLRDNAVLYENAIGSMEFLSRTALGKLKAQVLGLSLPHEGLYDVILLANGIEVERQQFRAGLFRGTSNG